ncbi:hypothetical protein SDC49_00605 [Lactobacillus sp. R2/2]|nr:hypothetical protein [Lactobacillus sp. R2/2]
MPRKGHVAKRDILADPVYNSKLVTKLINHLMIDGKELRHLQSFMMLLTLLKKRLARSHLMFLKKQ